MTNSVYKRAAQRISIRPELARPGDIERYCRRAQAPSPLDYGDYDDVNAAYASPRLGDYYDATGYTENGHYPPAPGSVTDGEEN